MYAQALERWRTETREMALGPARLAVDEMPREAREVLEQAGIRVLDIPDDLGESDLWAERAIYLGANVISTAGLKAEKVCLERGVQWIHRTTTGRNLPEFLLARLRKLGFEPEAVDPPRPEPAPESTWKPDGQASCYSKKRYSTEDLAKKVADKTWHSRYVRLRVYPCYYCGGYHLTKRL
jgi:hypothetical protein